MPSSPGTPAPAIAPGTRRGRVPLFTAEAWAPLKVELFRSLWIATSIAQIGTWVREAAGPTLMEHLTSTSPIRAEMVARVLVFSNLPICLFSVIAGALADVLDRRRLLIVTQIWMVLVSAVLGILTYTGHIHPIGLLAFIFLLGVGTAAFGPALQAVLPELVPKQHFALAINMNSIALNVARAVGPALFILVVAIVPGDRGAGLSFLLTALSFVGAVWVLYRWKRPPQRAAVHGEEVWNGIYAGWRYTIHSPANRAILLRVLTFIVPAVVIWSQVPIIAKDQLLHRATLSAQEVQQISALLFAFVGTGAILGVLLMPGLHARYKIDPVVNVCTALFASGLIVLAYVHHLWLAAVILIFLGINWVVIPTNFNTATQKSVPLWVKGRAISFYLTVLFGSFAIGGAIWGRVTTHFANAIDPSAGIHMSLLLGGLSMACLLALAWWFPLTINEGLDLSPAHDRAPPELADLKPNGEGPVRITVQYRVPAHRGHAFGQLLGDLRRTRLRNGARAWRIDAADAAEGQTGFTESITFASWQEYARSFSRMTKWDAMLEGLTREYQVGTEPPRIVAEELRRGFPVLGLPGRRAAAAQAAQGAGPAAESAPAEQSQPVGLAPAGGRAAWLEDRLVSGLDRFIDETFAACDRLARKRARPRSARQQEAHDCTARCPVCGSALTILCQRSHAPGDHTVGR